MAKPQPTPEEQTPIRAAFEHLPNVNIFFVRRPRMSLAGIRAFESRPGREWRSMRSLDGGEVHSVKGWVFEAVSGPCLFVRAHQSIKTNPHTVPIPEVGA
jgi:hypothetical protein